MRLYVSQRGEKGKGQGRDRLVSPSQPRAVCPTPEPPALPAVLANPTRKKYAKKFCGTAGGSGASGGSGQYGPTGLRSGSGRCGVAGGAGLPHGHGPRSVLPASTRGGQVSTRGRYAVQQDHPAQETRRLWSGRTTAEGAPRGCYPPIRASGDMPCIAAMRSHALQCLGHTLLRAASQRSSLVCVRWRTPIVEDGERLRCRA